MVYLVIAALLIATTAPAHAYIDAGSGSYMIQMAMAGILAVVFTIKLYWLRLKAFVARLFTRNQGSKTRSHG
jgi:hypothetical protein